MKKSKQIAFSGIISALSLVLMFFGSVVWIFTYIAPLLTGILLVILKDITNVKTSLLVFVTVSIVSILFFADKECGLTYFFFFGFYPLLKQKIDTIKIKPLQILLKFLVFNVGIVISQMIYVYVLGMPFENIFGKFTILVLLLIANVIFVIYERLLYMLDIIYRKKFKR